MFTNPQLIMGLDMYLYGIKTFSALQENKEKKFANDPAYVRTFEYTSLLNNHNLSDLPLDDTTAWASYSIKLPLAYWRKANHIHGWFVKNVQGGNDNCAEYSVSRKQLDLLNTAATATLSAPSRAKEYMPTTEGFFFGSSDYNDYYFEELRSIAALTRSILDLPTGDYSDFADFDDIIYYSSW